MRRKTTGLSGISGISGTGHAEGKMDCVLITSIANWGTHELVVTFAEQMSINTGLISTTLLADDLESPTDVQHAADPGAFYITISNSPYTSFSVGGPPNAFSSLATGAPACKQTVLNGS